MNEVVAGQELDTLVAEKVMGWKITSEGEKATWIGLDGKHSGTDRPPYSTSIAAAWEVVEKLKHKGYWWVLTDCEECGWAAEIILTLTENDAPVQQAFISAPTAPHAICLAALRAVGEKHPSRDKISRRAMDGRGDDECMSKDGSA